MALNWTNKSKVWLVGAFMLAQVAGGIWIFRSLMAPDRGLTLSWQQNLGTTVSEQPQLLGGNIYVISDDERVHAFDQRSGRLLWKFLPEESAIWKATLVAGGDFVYFAAKGGTYFALNAGTGTVVWKANLGLDSDRRALLHEGTLFVPTTQAGHRRIGFTPADKAVLVLLDARTGNRETQFVSDNILLTTPSISGATLYVAGVYLSAESEGGRIPHLRLHALDLAGGLREKWRYESKDGRPKMVLAAAGVVSFVAYRDFLVGLDATSGELLWRKHTGNWVNKFGHHKGRLIYGSANNRVVAVDMKTGRTVWKHVIPVQRMMSYIVGAPMILNGTAYWINRDTQEFTAADASTGEVIWTSPTVKMANGVSEPVMTETMVFVPGSDGRLYAYELY